MSLNPTLPVLVVGDVHGDLERLFKAVAPYDPQAWTTLFLGDVVDGGPFGVGALRFARDRPNTEVLLGNHEVFMLWALRDRATLSNWMSVGGQPHDLEELRKDADLRDWLAARPLLLRLGDGTIAQHADTDLYDRLVDLDQRSARRDPVIAINAAGASLMQSGDEALLASVLSSAGVFRQRPDRLQTWLDKVVGRRVIHGHSPHRARQPDQYAGGRAVAFDGNFSRFVGGRFSHQGPVAATVAPLPPLVD